MPEHEHERDTDATGSGTSEAAERADDPRTPDHEETDEAAQGERGPFGGMTPGEASRKRWEAAREREHDTFSTNLDSKRKMAKALQKRAETGDVKAYEAWQRVLEEIEIQRATEDGATGPQAWEALTPHDRRLLLDVLRGEAVVLRGEEAEAWRASREGEEAPAA